MASTKRLFWFVSVPIVLAWVSFASLAVYQSVVNGIEITENQLTVIGIVGGPALLIITNLLDFTYDDFELLGYDPHPLIKAPVAV